ncbi:hypothetical protein [Nonomuraea fuscirosea]|uniref:hypothetical protein n=1 Tax=Nonomuraea fuscirosea TaxID=1291556 RepID=UPI003412CB08
MSDRLCQALTAKQQRRERVVTATATAEQAHETAAQDRANTTGAAARLRGELADLTRTLKTAQQQGEEAVTAAAVAQALLSKQDRAEPPGHPEPAASSGHDAQLTNDKQQPHAAR